MPRLLRLNLNSGRSALHHIGARFVTQERGARLPENDTIVAAAAVAWMNVTGRFPDEWFGGDTENAAACSSLLPVIRDEIGGEHLYLPLPPKSIEIDPETELHLLKVVNKIKWLREDIWKIWADGRNKEVKEKILAEYFSEFEKKNGKPDEPPLSLSEFDGRWVKMSVQERVLLQPDMLRKQAADEAQKNIEDVADDEVKVSMPYRVATFRFAKGASAALVVDAGAHELEFLKAIAILGKMGLGGDRTYGYGQFEFDPARVDSKFEANQPTGANAALTLGLMYPVSSPSGEMEPALLHSRSRWQAISRQGRNTVPGTSQMVVSKRVRMVDKGALLAGAMPGAIGYSVNVFPDSNDPKKGFHPERQEGGKRLEELQKFIWRSGRTIALPVKLPDESTKSGGTK